MISAIFPDEILHKGGLDWCNPFKTGRDLDSYDLIADNVII